VVVNAKKTVAQHQAQPVAVVVPQAVVVVPQVVAADPQVVDQS
jgi:hypothetical protein